MRAHGSRGPGGAILQGMSTLEVPVKLEKADLSLPAGPEGGTFRVSFPALYTGTSAKKVLTFASEAAGEALLLALTHEEGVSWTGVVRLTGARLEVKENQPPTVRYGLVLERQDAREVREFLEFLLHPKANGVVGLAARPIQEPLPFAPEEPDEEDPLKAGGRRKPRRAKAKPA